MRYVLILPLLILCSCAIIKPIHFDGRSATFQHHEYDFAEVMRAAKDLCVSSGKGVRHDTTACRRECVSTFSCTESPHRMNDGGSR